MKTKKKKEQFLLADTLFETGMDFDIIETITGVNASELLGILLNIKDSKMMI